MKYQLIASILFVAHFAISQNHLDSVDFHIGNYNYQKALELLNVANSTDNLYKKGFVLKNLNQYQEAIDCYNLVLQTTPEDPKVLIELAMCYESINNFKLAQSLFSKAVVLQPDNLFLIQKLANTYFQNEEFINAVEYYHQAELKSENYFIAKQIARCYERIDSVDLSINYYIKALNFNPADAQLTLRLANIFRKLGDVYNGLDLTEGYLESDSTNTKILSINALFHYLDTNYPEAINKFERCLELNDTSYFVVKNLGYSYFKNRNYEDAKNYLEIAFKRDTTNAELCYMTGMACAYSVYKQQGVEYLAKSIDLLTPSSILLSKIYAEIGKANIGCYKYNDALSAYLKAYEYNATDTVLVYTIASHYDTYMEDKQKALEYYEKFMETRPKINNSTTINQSSNEIAISLYAFVERRIAEIKKESFWKKE